LWCVPWSPPTNMSDQYGAMEGQECQPLTHQSDEISTPKVAAEPAPRRNVLPRIIMGMAVLGAAGVVYSSSTAAEAETTAEVDLWTRLSDPAELLQYVAQYEIEKLGDEYTLDDDNFWPLSCADYDDDTVYPTSLCISGDNETCHDSSVMTEAYEDACSTACKEGWGVPCGWEAVKSLPSLCNGTFDAYFPSTSNNHLPSNVTDAGEITINSTGVTYWACNAHAFCYSCVDDNNVVNDFCKAAVIRTKSLYGASAVFKYLDSYWCDAEIIADIENGTFCGYSADKMHSCEDDHSHAR